MNKFKLKYLILATIIINTHIMYASQNSTLVINAVKHDTSKPLRTLPPLSEMDAFNRIETTLPPDHFLDPSIQTKRVIDPAIQITPITPALVPLRSFLGIGQGLGTYKVAAIPSDSNGSVGMNQYVQWVNYDLAVFDKDTGALITGFPKSGNSIWQGFGGLCETTNKGQPMVKYDQLAHRWVLSQIASNTTTTPPSYYECVAVSTSEDATGTYYRYAFLMDSNNGYGKLALWPDAYYMTFTMAGPSVYGPRICALDRTKMLAGQTATIQCQQLGSTVNTVLPADLDGQTLPATGTPEYIMNLSPPNYINFYKFHVDFTTPSNTTLTGPISISVAPYNVACPNSSGACAIQPNTTVQLRTINDRLMHRLAYRQFSNYASILATHTVQGPAPKNSPAIRWYELRIPTGLTTPTVYQQGTFAPDSKSRFIGSIAMDKYSNIAVGYTVSSSIVFPSPEFAMRLSNDPLNILTNLQPLYTGTGSQSASSWGDYTSMSIDPRDDCTFWYTSQFLMTSGVFNWSTSISNFKLNGCPQ
jgi:hypothetical protein